MTTTFKKSPKLIFLKTISLETSKDLPVISNEINTEMPLGLPVSLSLQMMPFHEKQPQIVSSIMARNRYIDDNTSQYSETVPGMNNKPEADMYKFTRIHSNDLEITSHPLTRQNSAPTGQLHHSLDPDECSSIVNCNGISIKSEFITCAKFANKIPKSIIEQFKKLNQEHPDLYIRIKSKVFNFDEDPDEIIPVPIKDCKLSSDTYDEVMKKCVPIHSIWSSKDVLFETLQYVSKRFISRS
jgi:hypothetical protein